MRDIRRLLRALGASGSLAAAFGCSDFSVPEDPAFGLPDVEVAQPTLTADVQPILTKRCSMGGCHSLASAQAGLVLTADSAYAMLVNRAAVERPELARVLPGRPDSSWMFLRVQPDESLRHGFVQMPLASRPLTPNQIATIANWIARGAPRE